MAGAIAFSVIYIWQIFAAVIAGRPVHGRLVNAVLSDAGMAGFLVFIALFICMTNDAHIARNERRKRRRMLLERESQSDSDFCQDVPTIDRDLVISLRRRLGQVLDVPPESIRSTDQLFRDLQAFEFVEELHKTALGDRTVFEVASDEVLEIVDKPDLTLKQLAVELRLLAEWAATEQDQSDRKT